jgi:hypothetical protein
MMEFTSDGVVIRTLFGDQQGWNIYPTTSDHSPEINAVHAFSSDTSGRKNL